MRTVMLTEAEAPGRAIADLDDEGRWISTYGGERIVGQAKFAVGEKYLSSEVFSRNLELLARSFPFSLENP